MEEKELAFQCLLMSTMFIIPAKPHVFTDGTLDPTHRCKKKTRRQNSKVEDHNLD